MEQMEAARAAIDHIRAKLILPIGKGLEEMTPKLLGDWRNELFVLDHFGRTVFDADIVDQIAALERTSGRLWQLLTEHEAAMSEIRAFHTARLFGLESDLVAFGEEYLSGEDVSIRDVLVNAIASYLNWRSNTAFIDAGKEAHRAIARSYLPEIQEELWEFLMLASETPDEERTLEHVRGIGARAATVLKLLDATPLAIEGQVVLLAFLYQWLLRLRLGRLLLSLESIAEST